MPAILENVSLKPFNTFGLDARAAHFAHCATQADVAMAVAFSAGKGLRRLVLGGGSNLLLTGDFPGLVLRIETRGIELAASDATADVVRVAAGENWHGFVMHALASGWAGLENLALIPGTVGAAPVQNIGAYGVELDSLFESLSALDVRTGAVVSMARADCGFAYRDSIFKRGASDRYVILDVTFRLPRGGKPETGYADVRKWLEARGIAAPTAKDVADAVIAIRSEKLPDPAVLGNAGSFFRNPLVSNAQFARLAQRFPGIVGYPQPDGAVKLAAGWLIEHAGWKGRRIGDAAVYERQALVLVNLGNATSADVIGLARAIQADVRARYAVDLEPEPVWT
jgi:UDP-N-acetylmuramate dehydrogenase